MNIYRTADTEIIFLYFKISCLSFFWAFSVDACVDLVRNWTRFEISLVPIVAMVTGVGICCHGYLSWIWQLLWAQEISKSSSDTLFLSILLDLDLSLVLLPIVRLVILSDVLRYNIYSRFVSGKGEVGEGDIL